jgi:DNA helicase HerA-like ATPase
LFERLPEVGDLPQPKLVFFFDEAHLLFNDIPSALLEKIEQVVRLIRSKGVGIYFVSQNPRDIPDQVLGQLGNRVQHALRAFTPADQKIVKATAETFRPNPRLNTEAVLTELAVGEALVSLLDANGQPTVVERAWILPPRSQVGPITPQQRQQIMQSSLVAGVYEKVVDRESAYEKLKAAHAQAPGPSVPSPEMPSIPGAPVPTSSSGGFLGAIFQKTSARGDSIAATMAKSVARSMSSTIGREIVRGVLGSLFGGRRR